MRKYIRRCLPLVLLLLLATLGYALRATRATPTPCRLFPKVCQLEKQPRRVNLYSARTWTDDRRACG